MIRYSKNIWYEVNNGMLRYMENFQANLNFRRRNKKQ